MSPDDTGRSGRSREFLDDDGHTLPERIRRRRTAQGMRSLELAQRLDVSPSYIAMIEHGKKVPSEETAVAIAELLGDDPELYRAWVHSTRFSDPTSTMRGLQRLFYSGPRQASAEPPRARLLRASERAARRRQGAPSPSDPEAQEPDESIAFLEARRIPRADVELHRVYEAPTPSSEIPLIALGAIQGSRVQFWRLPWALLDNDARPQRFVVAPAFDRDTVLVATPEQFVRIVMTDRGSNLMDSAEWRGWQDRPEPASSGGAHAQPLDPQGRLAPLLVDRGRFLSSLGERIDVILREGDSVSIRRLTRSELADILSRPAM